MYHRIEKVFAFIFLVLLLFLTWYLFLIDDFVTEVEERISGVFASLALGFGIFQFWVHEINIDRRKLYDLRYEAYKEFALQIERISESLHIEMTGDEVSSIHNLLSRLMNHLDRINTNIAVNSDFLFPGLHQKPETESIIRIVGKISTRTNDFRLKVEKATREGKDISRDFMHSHDRMRWHNDIRELLNELHTSKHNFYMILREHL